MSQRREFRELLPPDHVREVIADLSIDPGTEEVPIAEATGRVLAERVDAEIDVPGFDRASMDGYAVRAADTFGADERDPAQLDHSGAVHAGETPEVTIEPGTAAEISTGAVLPPGADAVVMVERTREREDDTIAVETGVAPGDNVMAAGADIGAGRRLLGAGTSLSARDIAVLAAVGYETIPVRARPRVGIVSTGDELVRPGRSIDHNRGQIFDVNSHSITAAVDQAGGEPHIYPHAGDDFDRMFDVLTEAAAECDLILSSGSTSASAVDVIYDVIEDGGELLVHGVAMKPGKPMIVGTMDESAYVGLPGYPVSALMVFRRFVADRIRAIAGRDPTTMPSVEARMGAEERFGEGRMRLLPVGTIRDGTGELLAYPVDKGSGATTSLSDADGVVEVPPNTAFVGTDEEVTVHLFSANVQPPAVLAVGEEDPLVDAALDAHGHTRFLPVGSREGRRRFERGIPDIVVVSDGDTPSEGARVTTWNREWGFLVPAGNPADVTGVADVVGTDLRFANLQGTSLRTAFDQHLDKYADEHAADRPDVVADITGYGLARTAHESAAHLVATGEADVGLGVRHSASHLPLDFVPMGEQTLEVYVRPDRREKSDVSELIAALQDLPNQL